MKVALFIPCYVDQFYPNVGMATVRVLEHLGVEVVFPTEQTCCGQPMANSGYMEQARPLAQKFIDVFDGYDYIVAPSGSCVSMVRNHYEHLCSHDDRRAAAVRQRTMELSEFLERLFTRYGLVFGEREAEQVLSKEDFDKKSFQANARRLEQRLSSLGMLRRLSDSCAYVENPYGQGQT